MGGADVDYGFQLAVGASGNVYLAGAFKGTADFDPGNGTYDLTSEGNYDIFISKLDEAGNFLWAKQIGGTLVDYVDAMTIDAEENIYTTGYFQGTADFNPGSGTANLSSAGNGDIFISKLDDSGNFIWAKGIGGTANDIGVGIGLDAEGNIYTTGYFSETVDFDPEAGIYELTSAGDFDVFTLKLGNGGQQTGIMETTSEELKLSVYPNRVRAFFRLEAKTSLAK
jgi:hypothetical protein